MKNKIASQFKKGFTILEMLMVLAIFGILTAVIMFNYGEFNSQTIMTNMSYEVALTVRQAQVYSLSVRGDIGSNNFDNHYGIYVNPAIDPKSISFFIDRADSNGVTDRVCNADGSTCLSCTSGTECLEKITLTRDVVIDHICVSSDQNVVDQNTGFCNQGDPLGSLTLTFARPNPDAIVNGDTDKNVAIVLKTSYGNQRAVIIKSTGLISVQALGNNQ